MTGINFSISSNESSVSTSKNTRLKPFEIHNVKFDGAEIKEGTSKAGNAFKLLIIKYSNDEGSAELSMFWPNPETDGERGKRTAADGHEYETPSRWDQTKTVITQTLEVLNPDGYKKMQELSSKFKTFDDMAKTFVTLVNKKQGEEVDVKFNGYINKQGYMTLTFPNIVGINKQGELFVSDNYIGHGNLGLSAWELKKGAELNATKPTPMDDSDMLDVKTEDKSDVEELNFDDL
jgi:hypothetical protein